MTPIVLSQTGVGATGVAAMDHYRPVFNVSIGAVVSGSATYTVQHTFDNVFAANFTPATATWFNHETLVSQTTSQDGNYAFPVRGIRVNVTAGSGTVSTTIIQSGMPGA